MNNKCLAIPKNREGEIDSDYGRYDTPNIVCIIFPDEEVDRMFADGVVDALNQRCDIGIDDYESEEIPFEKIEIAMSIVDKNKYPTFYKGLEYAKEYKEFLSVDL